MPFKLCSYWHESKNFVVIGYWIELYLDCKLAFLFKVMFNVKKEKREKKKKKNITQTLIQTKGKTLQTKKALAWYVLQF